MADRALQNRINTAIQQPTVDWAKGVGDAAIGWQKAFGPVAPGTKLQVGEVTSIVQAGALLSITYNWSGVPVLYGGGGKVRVIRLDTGEVLTPTTILTALSRSATGSSRIAKVVVARNSSKYGAGLCPSITAHDIHVAFSTPRSAYAHPAEVGVTTTGIVFYVFPAAANCIPQPVVVPFGQLTGMVNPLVPRLVAAHQPKVVQD
jgi:hypothetical protein